MKHVLARVGTALLTSLLAVADPAGAATDPALPGAYPAGLSTRTIPLAGGDSLETDIHYPGAAGVVDPAAGRCPLLVFGHGFASTKQMYAGHGAHWASRGYIVLIPNFIGGSDHSRNADHLVELVAWALSEDLDPASLVFGRIDRGALGTSGHSAGGLAALVAAAREPRIRATAPFDPVDSNGLGVGAMPSIQAPVAITYSEDSACNANGSSRALYLAALPIRRGVKIVGATHCDPLDPPNFGCNLLCGASTPARQELYRRYVTGWLEYWLRCDASYFEWVYGSQPQADLAAGRITWDLSPDPGPAPCASGSPPDPVERLLAWRSGPDVELSWAPLLAAPPLLEYRWYRESALPFSYATPGGRPLAPAATDRGGIAGPGLVFYQVRAVNSLGEGP